MSVLAFVRASTIVTATSVVVTSGVGSAIVVVTISARSDGAIAALVLAAVLVFVSVTVSVVLVVLHFAVIS